MSKFHNNKSIKLINSILLALSVVACNTNQINSSNLDNNKTSVSNNSNSLDLNKTFKVKYASGFNPTAYFLTYQDIRNSIKNKTIPDVFFHHHYTQNSEPNRLTNTTYLQIKSRLESGEFSEDAYLMANPDIKSTFDDGFIQSGYAHWYGYAITNEPTRKTKQEYIDAKTAIDNGFNEKAYRLAWTDIDNLVKTGALSSAYIHYNTWAKTNEPTRVTNTRYVKIKNAILEGYDENAYLLAYPDVKSVVDSRIISTGLEHYINYGINEGRLERDIYQDAKLAIVNDFNENAYRTAYPDINNAINLSWFSSAFEHFRKYGRYEGRLTKPEYINSKGKIGSEFKVNEYTTGIQVFPSIAADSNANFIITWGGSGNGDADNGVFAQRYNSSGVSQGSNFLVNSYTIGSQGLQSIAIDSNGNFIITWSSYGQDGSQSGVYAQRYNSLGVAQGSNFLVNSYTTGSQERPAIAIDSNGNFIITWHGPGNGDTDNGIFAQRYNSDGIPQGSNFLVNSYTTESQERPAIATDSNGNFIITWAGSEVNWFINGGIFAQRYNSDGIKQGTEFSVNSYKSGIHMIPSIATDSNGNFIIVWSYSMSDLLAQRYNSNGIPQGSNFLVTEDNAFFSKMAADKNGNFIVSWNSNNDVFAQRFNSDGIKQGYKFLVNSYTTGLQALPAIAIDSSGNFIITWHGQGIGDTSEYGGIFAQRYSSQ